MGSLTQGVQWGEFSPTVGAAASIGANGRTGTVHIDITEYERPSTIREDMPDNRIIAVAWHLHKAGYRAVFVSKDLSARIKSDSLGIKTEDFKPESRRRPALHRIHPRHRARRRDRRALPRSAPDPRPGAPFLGATTADGHPYTRELQPNQFLVFKDDKDENHTRPGPALTCTGPRKPVSGLMARNVQQTMALDLLMDDDVRLVTLLGSTGTGKTPPRRRRGHGEGFQRPALRQAPRRPPHHAHGRNITATSPATRTTSSSRGCSPSSTT